MKYTFFLSLILLFSNLAHSQNDTKAIKFRAFKATMFSPRDSSGWDETNILTVMNFSGDNLNKINVYAEKSIQYDIVKFIKDYKDENKTSWSVYKGINDDGEEFTIEWAIFNTLQYQHVSTLILTNKNGYGFVYKLKKNE